MKNYDHLLSPLRVKHLTLKNRIVSAPTSLANVGKGNVFTKDNIAYYEEKAKGGAAIVNIGDAIAHGATGVEHPAIVRLDEDDAIASMYELTSAIHKYGAYAAVEFGHGGKRCNPAFLPAGTLPIGPCDIYDENGKLTVRAMDRSLMDQVIAGYARSAVNCARTGFDILTIHAGHGWLLGQFLSPLSNHRTDEYGGSTENRCRFVIEILKAVRKAAPKCVIEIRISGSEYTANGYDLAEGVRLCKVLEPYVDMYNISAGAMEDLFTWILMHPSMFVPDGCNVHLAAAIKRVVSKPVSCVGAIGDPDHMEEILEKGQADIIALGRGLIADPELPEKIRTGRAGDIRRCLRCYSCFGQMMNTGNILCAVNPIIGQELAVSQMQPAKRSHKVAVVGGGPGGMQAAITAAERGHDVILYESSDTLGGALKFAEHEEFKTLLHQFAQWQIKQLGQLNVPIELNHTVTRQELEDLGVDDVICAVGASPITPDCLGIPGNNYVLATKLFDPDVVLGHNIVIMGGGLVGCETALHLAEEGHAVTVIEMAPDVALETTAAHRRALKVRMGLHPDMAGGDNYKPGIIPPVLQTSTVCKAITEDGVLVKLPDGTEKLLKADTVICALGLSANMDLSDSLRSPKYNFIPAGDSRRPRQVTQAVREAYDAVCTLS